MITRKLCDCYFRIAMVDARNESIDSLNLMLSSEEIDRSHASFRETQCSLIRSHPFHVSEISFNVLSTDKINNTDVIFRFST